MAAISNETPSLGAMEFLIHHVFLPPKLPQEDDFNAQHESFLVDVVLDTLKIFKSCLKDDQKHVIDPVVRMISRLKDIHGSGSVNEGELKKHLQNIHVTGTTIPLHIRAQNAGVLIHKVGDEIHVEAFELSPLNAEVMSTKGRLRRSFPGRVLSIERDIFNDVSFQFTLATTLAKMSHQAAAGTIPKVRKAGRMVEEDRDTAHPKIVTELLFAFMGPVANPIETPPLWKNTREEVLWCDSRQPWRRSPLWLLIRVAMQLHFSRAVGVSLPGNLYKTFMVFLMGHVVNLSHKTLDIDSGLIHAMTAKISRRLLKLNPSSDSPGLDAVQRIMESTSKLLQARWSKIILEAEPPCDLSPLSRLNFGRDTFVSLPKLDQYLNTFDARTNERNSAAFKPGSALLRLSSEELPPNFPTDSDVLLFDLKVLESWVESNLDSWVRNNSPTTCEDLSLLMRRYHAAARRSYSGNPETTSVMILTLLDIWIACDEVSVRQSQLLEEYDPSVPIALFGSLLLPFKSQMQRLKRAEEYFGRRRQNARHHGLAIFQRFGHQDSFSARYFQQCPELQRLLANIEQEATTTRQKKRVELQKLKGDYADLIRQHESINDHDTETLVIDTYKDINGRRQVITSEVHADRTCTKCGYAERAKAMKIHIHEWPLPSEILEKQSVVFELRTPSWFGHWRDTAVFFLFDVLEGEYSTTRKPRATYPLQEQLMLASFFKKFGDNQRIHLLSQDKPHEKTHRNGVEVSKATESDVLRNSGSHYMYHDNQLQCFVDKYLLSDKIPQACTFKLPSRLATLQYFIDRPPFSPSNPCPNAVIANLSECPTNMSVAEYTALGTLPIGFLIQWRNIGIELEMPTVDFKKVETALVVLQIIEQAGPPRKDNDVLREGHFMVAASASAIALLNALEQALQRIKENWESSQALNIFISLATRILSLVTTERLSGRCLAYLARTRAIAFKWAMYLKSKACTAIDDVQRADFRLKAVEIALICANSFNLERDYLDQTLSVQTQASLFIQCCISIQEEQLTVSSSSDSMVKLLYQRWKDITFRSSPILRNIILQRKHDALNDAITKSWSAYEAGDSWQTVSAQCNHWLVSKTKPGSGTGSLSVHFNLLDGKLLVNGLPLARLPSEYEKHPIYHTLFGNAALEIMPTAVPGMQFSGKNEFLGYNLLFNMERYADSGAHGEDFVIQALRNNQKFELVPSRIIAGEFPTEFIENFVHWYNITKRCLEFRPIKSPWTEASEDGWILAKYGSLWRLMKDGASLISIKSDTARQLSKLLSPLENATKIHCIFHQSASSIDIELPRFQLGFGLKSPSTEIQSRQFRGMRLDTDQSLGTLVGLSNKLVLVDEKLGSRLVLIPEGLISSRTESYGSPGPARSATHVQVKIDTNFATKVHAYKVEKLVGTLSDNGSLHSKLLLCYLHSLTSFCLVDPLTRKTGTEQALSILESAAVRSYVQLSPDNVSILELLGNLTPGRTFYPQNERCMQQIDWYLQGVQVEFYARHDKFQDCVNSILDQAEAYAKFQPEWSLVRSASQVIDVHLLERDRIRSATFHVAGYGAEHHTLQFDRNYTSRDRGQNSSPATLASALSSIIYHKRGSLQERVQTDLKDHLWNLFSCTTELRGPSRQLALSELSYDARFLQHEHSSKYVAQQWIPLHRSLQASQSSLDKYRIMIWVATLAFANEDDVQLLQTLASFYTIPAMAQVSTPPIDKIELGRGAQVAITELRNSFQPALVPINSSPEGALTPTSEEGWYQFSSRRQSQFQKNQKPAVDKLLDLLKAQWPCEVPTVPSDKQCANIRPYIDIERAVQLSKPKFKNWFDNHRYSIYLERISEVLCLQPVSPVQVHQYSTIVPTFTQPSNERQKFVGIHDIFTGSTPRLPKLPNIAPKDVVLQSQSANRVTPRLTTLLERLSMCTSSRYEEDYVSSLGKSLDSLLVSGSHCNLQMVPENVGGILSAYLSLCQDHVQQVYKLIVANMAAYKLSDSLSVVVGSNHWPRVSPIFLLQQLARNRWRKIPTDWQESIVQYGLALTELRRAERLHHLLGNEAELIKELQNLGHTNWSPTEYPESLLLEVESGIMIREVQEQIAGHMRNPPSSANSMMQLNMGEGKSSVIVPIVAAALADGSRLVRVVVAKPQSKQMFQMLVSKLGGLLNRQVYHMPFSRAVKLGPTDGHLSAAAIGNLYRECMAKGGILLVQPEHILSFKLMVLECFIADKTSIGKSLLDTQEFFDVSSRDLVDESDENFSVKFELVYTMGTQRPVEFSPDRWKCISDVLNLVREFIPPVNKQLPQSLDVDDRVAGSFPRTRFLRVDAEQEILKQLARFICDKGTNGFPIARQAKPIRDAVYKYLIEPNLTKDDIDMVENQCSGGFWTSSARSTLLLLRGLLAGGIFAFAFGQKRWRVNYGLDVNRKPCTKLVVPYRAKDNPTARSEFSHPDVVILLSSLTYYYDGLQDDDLFLSFQHLLRSDQAGDEFQAWINDAPSLDKAFHKLDGINLKDQLQCTEKIFTHLRFSKAAVDYFLAHVVFPKEMKEFPNKLSASGWDIGQVKKHPTTGFSGTKDAEMVLPLSVGHLNLPEQEHTNALVIEYLLQPENSVALMLPRTDTRVSDAEALLALVIKMELSIHVILDVGAQILELSNLEVAKQWLKMVPSSRGVQAVVYCDDSDELCVLDRKGNIEALQTSSFATHLDVCLVYLDESHTRGIDLRLPRTYRAAVTLGPNLTKDRLVQACMRMRKLGNGQSVLFCIPEEIQTKILTTACKSRGTDIAVSDVLVWAITETFQDTRKSMPLWAVQGERFERQSQIWAEARTENGIAMSKSQAEKFLEEEMQSLEHRYQPRSGNDISAVVGKNRNANLNKIRERCEALNNLNYNSATLQEEQERELAPEIEQERHIQRAAPALSAGHELHDDVKSFVRTGLPVSNSKAYMPAFESLRTTSAAAYLEVSQFPRDLLVTADFATTILVAKENKDYVSDCYQRPVRWILTSTRSSGETAIKYMMIISPYEAHFLHDLVGVSGIVTIHTYSPRLTLGFRALDALDLDTWPARSPQLTVSRRLRVLLNLFAGQLYLGSFDEYIQLCDLLGLAWEKTGTDMNVATDGFILQNGSQAGQSTFKDSPTRFLVVLMTKIRRNCESIEKTHMGKILHGTPLTQSDFEILYAEE